MRLKYYLRGLGIGIAVTAAILGFSANGKTNTMTDAQIIARAKELGMVEQGVLSELASAETEKQNAPQTAEAEKADTKPETQKEEVKTEQQATEQQDAQQQDAEQQAAEQQDALKPETETKQQDALKTEAEAKQQDALKTEAEAKQQDAQKTDEQKQAGSEKTQIQTESSVIVAIYPGEGSYTVSRKLAALGLVESADIYDKFLCQNGYDKKLCTGNYEIKEGATADEIAKILTKRQ